MPRGIYDRSRISKKGGKGKLTRAAAKKAVESVRDKGTTTLEQLSQDRWTVLLEEYTALGKKVARQQKEVFENMKKLINLRGQIESDLDDLFALPSDDDEWFDQMVDELRQYEIDRRRAPDGELDEDDDLDEDEYDDDDEDVLSDMEMEERYGRDWRRRR